MNALIKKLSADKIVWWSLLASTVLIILSLLFILLFYRALPPLLPLFNQLPWGTERLGPTLGLIIPLAVCVGFLIMNSLLINYLYERIPVLSRMLSLTLLLTTLLTAVFVFRIVRLIM